MNFTPKYTITNKLLKNIKDINRLIVELNGKRFADPILYDLELEAKNISTQASTSIEGNRLNLTEVRKLLKSTPKNIKDTQREVINYNNALTYLDRKILDVDILLNDQLVLKTHKLVTDKLISDSNSGKYRKESVVVINPLTSEIVYLPPDTKDVEFLMNSLILFVRNYEGEIDPLILAGIFHKQFVIIHPFLDGNGRTCRLVTKVLLAKLGISTFNLFSFENFYNKNVSRYFEKVGVFGDYYDLKENIDFTDWLEYFTEGILDEINRVRVLLESNEVSPENSIIKDQDNLIKYIQMNGYITDKKYSEITDRAKATRVIDFNKLIDINMIERKGKGRSTYYVLKV